MIQGCVDWQRQGLAPPQAVSKATAEYLQAEDTLASWIDDCCDRASEAWTSTTELYSAWKSWAERSSEHAGSLKGFSQKIADRGFTAHRLNTGRGFVGLRLKTTASSNSWNDR